MKNKFFKNNKRSFKEKRLKNKKSLVLTFIAFVAILVSILPTNILNAVTRDFIFDFDGEIVHKNVPAVYVRDIKTTSFTYDQTGLTPGELGTFGDHYGYLITYFENLNDTGVNLTPSRIAGNTINFSEYVTKEGIYRGGVAAFDIFNLQDSGMFYNLIQSTKSSVTVSNGVDTETNKADIYILNPTSINVGRDVTDIYGEYTYSWEIKNESGVVVLSGSDRNPTAAEIASLPVGKYTIDNTVSEEIPPEFGTDLIKDTTSGAFEIVAPQTSANKAVTDTNNDGYASPKEELTYTISAKNTGTVVANDIDIKDTLVDVLPYIENGAAPANIVVNITSDKDTNKNKTVNASDLIAGMKFDLVAGETITVTFKVIVKADLDVTTITSIVNQAVVDKTNVDAEIPTGAPKVIGAKKVSDTTGDNIVSPDEGFTYVITAKNSGNATANDVEIKDTLSNVLPYIESGTTPANIVVNITSDKDASKNKTINVDDLIAGLKIDIIAGETITVTFKVVLKADLDVTTIAKIVNQAVVDKTNLYAEIPTGTSNIIGNKQVSDATGDNIASPSEELTYTITAKNSGNVTANGVEIKDALSNVLPYIENGLTPANIVVNITSDKNTNKNKTVSAADLITGMNFYIVADETITVTFKVIVKADLDVTTITSIINQATVDTINLDAQIPTGASNVTGTKKVSDMTGDDIASPSEELTYTITAKNSGNAIASNVEIKDSLVDVLPHIENGAIPTNIVVNITSDKDTNKNKTINAADLIAGIKLDIVAGETITVTFKVIVKADLDVTTITSIVNQAVVDKTNLDAQIPTGISQIDANKVVSDKENDGYVSPNEDFTYTITAKNNGDATASDVTIKDTLVDVLPYIENGAAPANIVVNITSDKDTNKNKTVNAADLIAGMKFDLTANETVTITFKVVLKADLNVEKISKITNTATVNNLEPKVEIPTADSKLIGTKKVSDQNNDGFASENETLLYTLEFENIGLCKALNVVIIDPLSAAGFKDASISDLKVNGIVSNANIKEGINIGDLEPGAKVIVTFNVKLANDTLKNSNELKNVASANDSTGKKINVESILKVKSSENKKEIIDNNEKNKTNDTDNILPKTGVDNTSLIIIIGTLLVCFSSIGIVKLKD